MEKIGSDIVIVGGGIVGAAIMYKLQLKFPEKKIFLIEKERNLASHQSGRNSGVIHSGIYYRQQSLKAKLCVEGRRQYVEFCRKFNVPLKICGKLVIATDDKEIEILHRIYENALRNGVEDVVPISAQKIKEIEPYATGKEALHVKCTGVTDFAIATKRMTELAIDINPDSAVFLNYTVTRVDTDKNYKVLITENYAIYSRFVVFACGLQADKIAKIDNIRMDYALVPFRGDFYKLKENVKHYVNNIIYPVPDPLYPFLGIHFTRMLNGEVECGPNALPSFSRENYEKFSFNFSDFLDVFMKKQAIKFFIKNARYGLKEISKALSKKLFTEVTRKMVPVLKPDDFEYFRSGIRAILIDKNGKIFDDFLIVKGEKSVHVLSAPSPAATSSLAIADHIIEKIDEELRGD